MFQVYQLEQQIRQRMMAWFRSYVPPGHSTMHVLIEEHEMWEYVPICITGPYASGSDMVRATVPMPFRMWLKYVKAG
jgi:hypothetical protein